MLVGQVAVAPRSAAAAVLAARESEAYSARVVAVETLAPVHSSEVEAALAGQAPQRAPRTLTQHSLGVIPIKASDVPAGTGNGGVGGLGGSGLFGGGGGRGGDALGSLSGFAGNGGRGGGNLPGINSTLFGGRGGDGGDATGGNGGIQLDEVPIAIPIGHAVAGDGGNGGNGNAVGGSGGNGGTRYYSNPFDLLDLSGLTDGGLDGLDVLILGGLADLINTDGDAVGGDGGSGLIGGAGLSNTSEVEAGLT